MCPPYHSTSTRQGVRPSVVRPSPLTGCTDEEKAFSSHVKTFLLCLGGPDSSGISSLLPSVKVTRSQAPLGAFGPAPQREMREIPLRSRKVWVFFFQSFRFLFIYFSFFHCESGRAQEQVARGGSSFPPRATPGFSTPCQGSPCPGMCPVVSPRFSKKPIRSK